MAVSNGCSPSCNTDSSSQRLFIRPPTAILRLMPDDENSSCGSKPGELTDSHEKSRTGIESTTSEVKGACSGDCYNCVVLNSV